MTLEELEIVVKANIDNATKKFEALKAQMDDISNDESTQKAFEDISNASDDMGKTVSNATKDFDMFENIGSGALEALTKKLKFTKAESGELATALSQVSTSLGTVLGVIGIVAIVIVAIVARIKLMIEALKALVKVIKLALTPRHESIIKSHARICKDC